MKAIDLFAGAGGFTAGATLAGLDVVFAANHWRSAVDTHAANHPETLHACQDLQQCDWREVPEHDVLLASPACQGHSKARGKDQPHHDATRSTAWSVIAAAEYHNPELIVVENVTDFLKWKLYPAWAQALYSLGYAVTGKVIDAADHGVPQHRERVFVVATKSQHPIEFELPQRDHVGIDQYIEWDSDGWSEIDKPGRATATLERVERGRAEYGDRFVMPYYGNGSGLTGRDVTRPLGTVTTRDRWALVKGDKMRMLNTTENKAAMAFPSDYILPPRKSLALHLLGNAVCPPVACDLLTAIREAA